MFIPLLNAIRQLIFQNMIPQSREQIKKKLKKTDNSDLFITKNLFSLSKMQNDVLCCLYVAGTI